MMSKMKKIKKKVLKLKETKSLKMRILKKKLVLIFELITDILF